MAVRYGVIGCGAIGQRRHIPEIAANKDAVLGGAVRHQSEARGRSGGEVSGKPNVYGSSGNATFGGASMLW